MRKIYSLQDFRKPVLISLLMLLLAPGILYAKKHSDNPGNGPEQTVNGKVKDAGSGSPLPGATVSLKDGSRTVISDVDGAFTITVPDKNSILVISFVGYATQEIVVGTNATLEILMQSNGSVLAQVVVVTYGGENFCSYCARGGDHGLDRTADAAKHECRGAWARSAVRQSGSRQGYRAAKNAAA